MTDKANFLRRFAFFIEDWLEECLKICIFANSSKNGNDKSKHI